MFTAYNINFSNLVGAILEYPAIFSRHKSVGPALPN